MTPVMFSLPEINVNLIVMIYKKLAELNDKNMSLDMLQKQICNA